METIAGAFVAANASINEAVLSAGTVLSPAGWRATIEQFAPYQLQDATAVEVERDISYGPDPRHKLDWFRPSSKGMLPLTVLVFVHGGGFVGGDKQEPESPLYDNIGVWAASNGLHAVTLTYRLAPAHPWPAAADDVNMALQAVADKMRDLADGPFKVYLMGHSAGAVHAASAVTLHQAPAELAGCILLSGFYDNTIGKPNPAYFGDREDDYASQSSGPRLAASDIPLFIGVAEFDPPLMHINAANLLRDRILNEKATPQFVLLYGNSHFSPVLLLNSAIDTLGPRLMEFMARPMRQL